MQKREKRKYEISIFHHAMQWGGWKRITIGNNFCQILFVRQNDNFVDFHLITSTLASLDAMQFSSQFTVININRTSQTHFHPPQHSAGVEFENDFYDTQIHCSPQPPPIFLSSSPLCTTSQPPPTCCIFHGKKRERNSSFCHRDRGRILKKNCKTEESFHHRNRINVNRMSEVMQKFPLFFFRKIFLSGKCKITAQKIHKEWPSWVVSSWSKNSKKKSTAEWEERREWRKTCVA